jgi:hypothetical protein
MSDLKIGFMFGVASAAYAMLCVYLIGTSLSNKRTPCETVTIQEGTV